MAKIPNAKLVLVVTILVMFALAWQNPGISKEKVTIAVIRDGPSREDVYKELIEAELKRLISDDADVVFKTDPSFDAQWDLNRIRSVIQNAMNDREVDIVLAIGALVTQEAGKPDLVLRKPFISSYVQRADLPRLPYTADQSLKDNFSVVVLPQRAQRDLVSFREMVPFTRLHVGVGEEELRGMVDVQNALQQIEDSLGIDLIMVPVTTDIQASLQNLDANAEAFYLTRISRLTWEQRKTFISELTSRKIATFSLLGHPDVEAGAMAGITPDIQEQVVRRVAINLSQVIRGVAVDELSIILTVDSKLLINAKTAKAVGYSPSLETLLFAEILHEEVLEAERRDLALADAMKMAVAGNTALSISDSEVETSKRDMQLARSVFLPQVSARASYEKNNIEAGLPISLGPEELTLAGIRATQLIYDDLAISNYRSSSRIYAGSRERREADRLDVLAEIGNAYYRVALADNRYRIVADNLKLTEDNLELSRLRQDIGYSGRDEVYRWQAELAQRRAGVFGSHAIRERGQIVLNQVLAGDQRVRFQIEEVPYENIDRYFLDGGLNVIFSSLKKIEKARSFVTNFALENAPELKFLDDFVASQQIQVSARKRRFFLPTVFANFFYEYRIDRTPDFPGGEKGFYVFEVTASYPLFLGGRRVYNVKREKSVLDGLEREKKLASERIEQRARVALRRLEASIPGVGFGHTASQSARQNLDIVNDKYALGIVNVTDLLEAQNESLRAELGAADAIYTYLLDLIEFQRSISWFQDERSQAEQDDFIKRLKAAISMP